MDDKIELAIGNTVLYEEDKCTIISIDDTLINLVTDYGEIKVAKRNNENIIKGITVLSSFSSNKIEIAKYRLDIIRPLILGNGTRQEVEKIAVESGNSPATLYRWIKKYKETGLMSSLTPADKSGGRGMSRLDVTIDEIVDSCIKDHYLSKQRKSIKAVYIEVNIACRKAKVEAPHYNTVRRRIASISEYNATKYRLGRSAAKKKFAPKINRFPDSIFPLSSVQIDHTPLDIIVVDDINREALGRPWLTLAIDTFSRMVVGYYLGFEKPNSMSVGLCLSQAILPKEEYLATQGIYSEWPCFGHIKCIHLDNAMEFRSKMLEDACLEYQMEINWRPVKVPNYGGLIERLLGSFSSEIHSLKGTTFRSLEERKEYDSEKEAIFTYKELEKWLTLFIVDVYHQKFHQGIATSPINKWRQGVNGTDEEPGVGYQPVNVDKRKVLLDFMPFEWRTIQDYGVLLDGIHYYNDILRRWINSIDVKSGKLRAKRKFKFKRDPRDISVLYFLDPELKEYFPVHYRDTTRPTMTKWELKIIKDELTKQGMKFIDEDAIFESYSKLREIEASSEKMTKSAKKSKAVKEKQKEHKKVIYPSLKPNTTGENIDENIFSELEAFEDIDDGTFDR